MVQSTTTGPGPMDIEPGMWIELQEEDLALQKYIADLQHQISRLQIEIGREANELQRQQLQWQMQQAVNDLAFRREELAETRKQTELKLATSPIDFVAYEMYKRYLHKQATAGEPAVPPSEYSPAGGYEPLPPGMVGIEPWFMDPPYGPGTPRGEPLDEPAPIHASTGKQQSPWPPGRVGIPWGPGRQPRGEHPRSIWQEEPRGPTSSPEPAFEGPFGTVHTDQEIQAMIAAMVGQGGAVLGTGAFGVAVPGTQAISRQEGTKLSPDEMAILSSFLRAGFQANGQQVSYDPKDYWQEVEEGWVPTLEVPGVTRYSL